MANDEIGKKILAEMEAEKAPEPVKEEPKVEPKVEPTPEVPKEEPKEVPKEETDIPGEPRKVLYIPVGQVHAEKKKLERELRAEYEEKMKNLQPKVEPKVEDLDIKKKEVAEKLGLDVSHIEDLMSLMPKPEVPLSKEDLEVLSEQVKTRKEEQEIKQQEMLYTDEFIREVASTGVKDQIAAQGYTPEEAKVILHDFVFTPEGEKYAQVPLGEIVGLKLNSLFPKKKVSAEKGSGGNSTGGKTFDRANQPTAEDISKMSDKEFKEYSDRLGQGSRFIRKN